MKQIVKIHRFWQDENQTSGTCVVLDAEGFPTFSSLSLERGWKNNENNISCIPIGTYEIKLEYSNRFRQDLWEIKGVPNRAECKFHASNYWYQLNGCIALGLRSKLINIDKYRDITNSKDSIDAFHMALKPDQTALLIITGESNIK